MPKSTRPIDPPDSTREEVMDAMLHADRAQHDELGRTIESADDSGNEEWSLSSPREQGAAPLDLDNVDE